MPHLGFQEMLIVLVVVLVLFGGKKLPELAKGMGEGLREFKKATRDSDDKTTLAEKTDKTELDPARDDHTARV